MKVVVLAGGSGKRLWPMSREDYPKQFMKLFDGKSLIQRTVDLFLKHSKIYIITSKSLYPLFNYEVNGVPQGNVLEEPAPRGTAPAIAYTLSKINDDESILFMPSDHFLEEGFPDFIKGVQPDDGEIVLFGHSADVPATGYGYIKPGKVKASPKMQVDGFKEKPDRATAESYVKEGYLWNMGMFYMKRETGIKAFKDLLPEIYRVVFNEGCSGYEEIVETSFDKGIVERFDNLSVVPYNGKWRDLGSWQSFYEVIQNKDERGNVMLGNSFAANSGMWDTILQ